MITYVAKLGEMALQKCCWIFKNTNSADCTSSVCDGSHITLAVEKTLQ